jgi:hypothetical protein
LEAAAGPESFVSGAYNMSRIISRRDRAQEKSRQKYFKGRVLAGERASHFVVWDGVRDYANLPPPNLLVVENLTGTTLIAQVRNPKVGIEMVKALLEECDSLVVWTGNTAVYRSIVENIKREANAWLS